MRLVNPALAVALTTACAAARPVDPLADAPRLNGLPVYVGAPRGDAATYWNLARNQRADVAPAVPAEASAAEIRVAFGPWLRHRAEALTDLARRVPALSRRSPDDALFADVVYASVAEDLREGVRRLPAPRELAPEQAAAFRSVRDAQSTPLARHAREAWAHCASIADRASPLLRPWGPVCAERARLLGEQLSAAPQSVVPPSPPPRRVVRIPPECDGPELREAAPDPEAPPPDERRPREVVLTYRGDRFQGAARPRLLTAVRAGVARLAGVRLVPQADVAAMEALVAQRRWRAGGPACGQPPPLAALLAARHPNLVVGVVETWCGTIEEGEGASAHERGYCTLSVVFHRAGSGDRDGLPPNRAVDVTGDPADVQRWVAAAAQLGDPRVEASMGGLLGALMGGEGEVFRVLGYGESDPWLRVGATLRSDDESAPRDALVACATREGGVGSYRASWTIAPDGAARDVAVAVQTAPTDGSGDRVAECLRAALGRVAFPCPRGGAAAPVSARLCVGRSEP
jgi:hypothetical protein